jgi:hypothetical protein
LAPARCSFWKAGWTTPGGGAGPGDWIWEPAGSRQEATRFVEDTLVLVNLYGPALFDDGSLMDWRAVQALRAAA